MKFVIKQILFSYFIYFSNTNKKIIIMNRNKLNKIMKLINIFLSILISINILLEKINMFK